MFAPDQHGVCYRCNGVADIEVKMPASKIPKNHDMNIFHFCYPCIARAWLSKFDIEFSTLERDGATSGTDVQTGM